MMSGNPVWRKSVNAVMLSVTALFTIFTVATLFLILGYLLYYGGRSLDWNFFTKLPLPPGEIGGGMANAIVGSAEIVGVAALMGLPFGFLAGVYLSEFEDKRFAPLVRYVADLLNGIPSVVVGISGLGAGRGPDEVVFRVCRVDCPQRNADPHRYPPDRAVP